MIVGNTTGKALLRSGIYTVILSLLFVFFTWADHSAAVIFTALPYFIILYFVFFVMGKPEVSEWLRSQMQSEIKKIILFPLILTVVYYSYIIINGDNPFKGTVFLLPYLFLFPALVFAANKHTERNIDWLDFTTLILFVLPVTIVKIDFGGEMPYTGNGFDSVFRIAVMLSAVYAFVIVRNLHDVGCYPVFRWRSLFTVLWVWLAFYVFVFAIGYSVNFIRFAPEKHFDLKVVIAGIIPVFLHTALFEELVFRGLLQNLLGKRIDQSRSWMVFWSWGLGILLLIALLAGYSLHGSMQWFPAMVTIFLFAAALGLIKWFKLKAGDYTSLAITSVIFGLVHYHSGSIIFFGLACIGGWAYGYCYLKTRNVFYCALLHALVNTSPLIFGLVLAK